MYGLIRYGRRRSGIHENVGKRLLVEFIVSFSTTTEVQVLAEGIEEPEEWETLKELGVEWAQGYFFSKLSRVVPADSSAA